MKIFTKYYGVITFLVLVLFSFSLSAQNRSAKTNFLVPVLKEKSVLTNHKPVVSKYTESNVTVTTLLNEYAFPYDVSQSGKFVTLTSFGTDEGYFWNYNEKPSTDSDYKNAIYTHYSEFMNSTYKITADIPNEKDAQNISDCSMLCFTGESWRRFAHKDANKVVGINKVI